MDKPLADRIALVTGASRGIGYATAVALARRGAHVVAVARTVGGLEELDDAIRAEGGSATLVPLDVIDTPGIARLADALQERYGRVDVLVGNAAIINVSAPVPHIEPKIWDQMLAVNVSANFHLIRFLDPLLRTAEAGRAVFVSSGAARNAAAYRSLYSLTKAALETLVKSYAAETATTNLRVNLFTPGRTHTRMQFTAFPGADPAELHSPEEVAEQLVALCLPSFTATGQVVPFKRG